jgi:hypothetical protein
LVEAKAEVDIGIGDVAQVRIRGGRREAQEAVRDLEKRWSDEVWIDDDDRRWTMRISLASWSAYPEYGTRRSPAEETSHE